jgi:hypothetical protein
MPTGEHLDRDHQSAAGRARWQKATPQGRARQLRASAAAFLRRAEELDPSGGNTFTAAPDDGDQDGDGGTRDGS